MTPQPKISIGNQITGIEAAIKRVLPFKHKSSAMAFEHDALKAAIKTLEIVSLHANEIRALVERKRQG